MHYGTYVLEEPNGRNWQVDDFNDDLSALTLVRILRITVLRNQLNGIRVRYLPSENVNTLIEGEI